MSAESNTGMQLPAASARGARDRVLAVFACVAAPLLIFAPTVLDMVAIWRRSEVFAHCFLVFPAFAYLVWQTREELESCAVRPAALGLVGVVASAALWSLGVLASALAPSFFGLISLSIFTVITVLGWQIARTIWVPLLFLYFAVPFGEVFVPTLVEWTADFTVAAVAASGVPVFREGPNFVIPSGQWSVVDACSGIRYLMASTFAGFLYAWLMYRSTGRRLAFIAASIAVPIVANWLRAYMIVMLGHLSNNKIATGVDHVLYGWVFFGIVMFLLFAAGAYFREDLNAATSGDGTRKSVTPAPAEWRGAALAALGVGFVAAGVHVVTLQLESTGDARPVEVRGVEGRNGWTAVAEEGTGWRPVLRAPSAMVSQGFVKDGRRVSVFIGVYRNQTQDSELVNSMNDLFHSIVAPWTLAYEERLRVSLGTEPVTANGAVARRSGESLAVMQWYWVDGRATTSDARAKATLAIDRLLRRSDTSAWVAIAALDHEDGRTARKALTAFAAEMGPAIDDAIQGMAGR